MFQISVKTHPSPPAAANLLRTVSRTRNFVVLISLLAPAGLPPLLAQDNPQSLSPSESYKSALAPFTQTRSQANDLTDADRLALRIGIAKSSRDCLALSSPASSTAGDAKEVFALGQLCLFGQQYEPARAAFVNYLALPKPPQRELALSLLIRAYLGLKQPGGAEPPIHSLLRDYPYDPLIHAAISQVIDSSEGSSQDRLAVDLCATQTAKTLPLLAAGKALEGKDGSTPAATLFADAVRCVALASNPDNPDRLQVLTAILQQPGWAGTADLAPMQAALGRQQLVGKHSPLPSLHGFLPGTNSLSAKVVWLNFGTVMLVSFTLWSPSTPEILRNLAKLAPQQPILAITSWHANTWREDLRSTEVLQGLRSWQSTLPKRVSIVIVPDQVLVKFQSDVFPAGILIRDGTVLSNSMLSSEGAERLLVNNLLINNPTQNKAGLPPAPQNSSALSNR